MTAHTPTQGNASPQLPSLETLRNVLASVDKVAVMLDHALRYPATTVTPEWSRSLAALFHNLAEQMECQWHIVNIGVLDRNGIAIQHGFEVCAVANPKEADLQVMCERDPETAAIAARFVLDDWRGVFGPDGNPLDFSIASLESVLSAFPGIGARIAAVVKGGCNHE